MGKGGSSSAESVLVQDSTRCMVHVWSDLFVSAKLAQPFAPPLVPSLPQAHPSELDGNKEGTSLPKLAARRTLF